MINVRCTFNIELCDARLKMSEGDVSLLQPLDKGETVMGVIGYREKTKSGRPKYCLYSPDGENLLIAAEEHSSRLVISKSSKVFDVESVYFMGTIAAADQKFSQVVARDPVSVDALVDILKIGIGRRRKDLPECTVLLVFQSADNPIFFTPKVDYGSLTQASRDEIEDTMTAMGALPSPRNQVFKYIVDDCLVLAATGEDEYKLIIGHPLSVFQGFAIAVAILKNIEPAN